MRNLPNRQLSCGNSIEAKLKQVLAATASKPSRIDPSVAKILQNYVRLFFRRSHQPPTNYPTSMAKTRSIEFEFAGSPVKFNMIKVDRNKLYGYKIVEVLDENDEECELTTLADDGKTLIGKGGTGIGYLDADGNWSDKSQLNPVDLEGKPIEPVLSSFSAPIQLAEEISIEDYLDHNIRLIYQLEIDEATHPLIDKLKSGAIFLFDYSFRGGLEADAGIMLINDDEEIFFLVGDKTNVSFKGLQQSAPVATDEGETTDDEAGLMDFGMI